jgi:N-acetylglucosamine-6-phosphate deacetylase
MAKPVTIITGATVIGPDGPLSPASVVIEGDTIRQLTAEPPASLLLSHQDVEIISVTPSFLLTPGLIDLQCNGGFGCDFTRSPIPHIQHCLGELPRYGVTSVLPTIISSPLMDMVTACNTIEEVIHISKGARTRIAGIHLEGPFLNPQHRGSHPAAPLQPASLEATLALLSPNVKMMTLAPELDPEGEVIRHLNAMGVRAAAGHSGASYEEMLNAVAHGVSAVTHLFNAMHPFHHRDPGLAGVALNAPGLLVTLIADGYHVHPEVIRTVLKLKDFDKVIMVSDSNPLSGLPEGEQRGMFGEQPVQGHDGRVVNQEGHLAGSAAFLDTCVRNLVQWRLASFTDAIRMASTNVAQYLGIDQRVGKIAPGLMADLVLWNRETLGVEATWIGGELVYKRENATIPGLGSPAVA